MNALKTISRLILGVVFTFSGFVKAVDPVGSEIKFTDYFNALGLESWSSIALVLAVILSGAEFIVGFALLLNIKPRLSAIGALIFMTIFTPLTLWVALANPVSDCGCFGDALVITNWETFWKNIVLLVLAIILLIKTGSEENWINKRLMYSILGLGIAFVLIFQIYNIRHLPVIDFRPYSVGTSISEKMLIPEDAQKDSVVTYLYYTKNGITKEFTAENYPWEDTTWVWKDTKTKIVKKGYVPEIHDFEIRRFAALSKTEKAGSEVSEQILADTSYSLLLISVDFKKAPFEKLKSLTNLMNYCIVHNYETYFITASVVNDIMPMKSKLPFSIDFYVADGTTLKTMIRSNPGLMLLKEGKIIAKWHYNDFPSIKEFQKIVKK